MVRTGKGHLVVALMLLAPGAATAEDFTAGSLLIQHPWVRATPNGAKVAAGYVSIINRGSTADSLTGGSVEVADRFVIHDMTTDKGVMRMREAGPLKIPPGGSLTLSPAGHHIMLTELHRGLRKGETLEGSLTFAHAGTVQVRFSVEDMGARIPAATDHAMPGMRTD